MEDSLGASPTNIRFEKKRSREDGQNCRGQKEGEEDISAMDFSRKEVEVENIEFAAKRVRKEGKQGKQISKNIMEEIDPYVLDKMDEKKQKRSGQFFINRSG